MLNRTIAVAATSIVFALSTVIPAQASTYTLYNSIHSDQAIGVWADDHCGGTLHLINPGHHRSNVGSVKAYGEHNTLIKPSGARKTLLKRHCYKVTGNNWKVKALGD